MSVLPDTTSMLRIILDCPKVFPVAHRNLHKAVVKLIVDEAKTSANLPFFSELNTRFGKRDLRLLLDAIPLATTKAVIKAADKDNPGIRGATPEWVKEQLIFLAEGGVPYVKPAPAPSRARTKKAVPTEEKKIASKKEINPTKAKSSKAKWDGKNRDSEPV